MYDERGTVKRVEDTLRQRATSLRQQYVQAENGPEAQRVWRQIRDYNWGKMTPRDLRIDRGSLIRARMENRKRERAVRFREQYGQYDLNGLWTQM